jgi:hypothetical protein
MEIEDIFALGLGLSSSWEVREVKLVQEPEGVRYSIFISISKKNGKFIDEVRQRQNAYDVEGITWRHINFFSVSAITIAGCRVF